MPHADSLLAHTADPPVSAFGPVITPEAVTLRVPDEPGLDKVRLELDFPPGGVDFVRSGALWSLRLPRPQVDRMEYQLSYWRDGRADWSPDPTNSVTVPNPFGAKSQVLFPDYAEPAWLAAPLGGQVTVLDLPAGPLEVPVPVRCWSPDGLDPRDPAPLLVAHDGSDMADRGSLLRWAGQLPTPIRVALLDPPVGYRDTWYAANSEYADHIATIVLPAVREQFAVSSVIGLGASLGALSMLFISRRHSGLFAALALQSGSFFTPRFDPQESGYRRFDQVCAAVAAISAGTDRPPADTPAVLISCGAVEENRANNERMAAALAAQGYPVEVRIFRDAHTMIGWRDALSPAVDELIARVASNGPAELHVEPARPAGTPRSWEGNS